MTAEAMKINRIGVDLAKNVFQLHGADHKGKLVISSYKHKIKYLV